MVVPRALASRSLVTSGELCLVSCVGLCRRAEVNFEVPFFPSVSSSALTNVPCLTLRLSWFGHARVARAWYYGQHNRPSITARASGEWMRAPHTGMVEKIAVLVTWWVEANLLHTHAVDDILIAPRNTLLSIPILSASSILSHVV